MNKTFMNCDGTPHSYMALFPNFAEDLSSDYSQPRVVDVCDVLLENPSGRVMPAEYFTFMESQWGGCGPILQKKKDGEPAGANIAAIGFR